jgi:hypothetical protein
MMGDQTRLRYFSGTTPRVKEPGRTPIPARPETRRGCEAALSAPASERPAIALGLNPFQRGFLLPAAEPRLTRHPRTGSLR